MSNVNTIRQRPAAPAGLSKLEAAAWKALVADWPADHFKRSDLPLLAEYIRALSMAEELGGQVDKCDDMQELKTVLDLRDRESRRAAALARTLRLAPQSRYDRHATATMANSANGKRPWEHNPFDDI